MDSQSEYESSHGDDGGGKPRSIEERDRLNKPDEEPEKKTKTKTSYNKQLFKKLSKEYHEICTEDEKKGSLHYTGEKLNRDTRIHGKCATPGCCQDFDKTFRDLHENKSPYCKSCTTKVRIERAKETNMERYGGTNPMHSEAVKGKIKETNMERYGVANPSQSEAVKGKIKETNMERYGVANPMQSEAVKGKAKETNMERYGVANPMQNPEISEKCMISCYKSKEYTFPSGKKEFVQGYEPWAIDELLEEVINEQDIIVKRSEVPVCLWISEDTKEHRYFVDIYVKSQNRCIEVKSNWTYEVDIDSVELKLMALKGEGYDCELWIYNADKTCVKRKI